MAQQTLIGERDKVQLKRTFRKDLKADVTLKLFTQKPSVVTIPGRECPYCAQTQQLMDELSSLSPKLRLETVDFYQEGQTAKDHGISRIPAVALSAAANPVPEDFRVKFYGIPMGYELATLVEDIKTISRGVSPLSTAARRRLREINQAVHIQVFVTPADASCAVPARLAHAMALECPNISADVVEIQEFPALAQNYGIRSVPFTVINEHIRFGGPVTETQLLEKVLQAGVRGGSSETSGG
jgi:glutaredoxin-like protein